MKRMVNEFGSGGSKLRNMNLSPWCPYFVVGDKYFERLSDEAHVET